MLSSSGFRDALGERDLRFNRESGEVHERLFLRPELAAYESALRRRIERLAALADPKLVPIESLEHDPVTRRLAVVSTHASGLRLDQILRTAREHELVPDLTVALYLTAELLLAAHSFQSLAGVPHGAIAPERVIVAPEGEVLLTDYAYAEVIEAASFRPARLWREFGIASWLGEPFSLAGDVRQCALVGIALMLGRPLAQDASERFDSLLAEVDEAATIRGGRLFADPVVAWLRRAVAAGTDEGFKAAADAAQACASLLTDRERSMARPAVVQFLAELDAPPPISTIDDFEPIAPAESVSSADTALAEVGDGVGESLEEELATYAGPGPEFLPVAEPESFTEFSFVLPDSDLIASPEPPPELSGASEPETPAMAAAVESAEPPARNRVPPSAPVEVTPDSGPRVVSPSPFAVVLAGPRSAASVAALPEDELLTSSETRPQPVPAVAVAPPAPVFQARARAIEPPPVPAPVLPPPAVPVPAATESPIRLKGESTIRLKNPTTLKRSSGTSLRLDDRPESVTADQDDDSPGWVLRIPWKYVAAAVAVLAVGAGAATMDWGSSTPVEASKPPAPVEAPPPPPPTTGSIEVLSNTPGSKVFVDGKLRGETPLTIDDLKPGRHTVVVRAANGNVRRTVRVAAGETAKIDLAVYSGWVVVSAPIELQVLENGKVIGTAGEGPLVLSAGHHTIEVANTALDYRSSHAVDIQPGEEHRLDLNPKGLANLNAVPWAEVWLDGAKVGDTPLGNVSVPLGIREFVFKHPQFGERKISTTITGAAPAQVIVDFTK
jgi:PEGA domain-containing protein